MWNKRWKNLGYKSSIVIFLLCFVRGSDVQAQDQSVGLSFDYGKSYAQYKYYSYLDGAVTTSRPSYNVGLYYNVPIKKNWSLHFQGLWMVYNSKVKRSKEDERYLLLNRSFLSLPVFTRFSIKGFYCDIGLSNNFTAKYDRIDVKPDGNSNTRSSYEQKFYILGVSAGVGYNIYKRFYLNLRAAHLFMKEAGLKVENLQYTLGIDFRLK